MGFSTDAIHGGQKPEDITGAVTPPIFQTSTYKQNGIGDHRGYEYARTQNPTREALERNVAVLERGRQCVAFSSGMSAIDAVLRLVGPGDEVLVTQNVYGGTFRLFEQVLAAYGLTFHYVDTTDAKLVESAISPRTRMLFIETPTNPVLQVADITALSTIAHVNGITVVVDNTFLSPYFQNPLHLGADIVLHSTTKYLNGHSDMIGGVVVVNDQETTDKLRFLQNAVGAVPSPFDCWLALRGVKTLAVRMKQHEENARGVAPFLADHKAVERVYYPGLPDHPQHELATRQCRGFGGMIAFDVGTIERADEVLKRVEIFTLAESLGGVESLICHPATMTHGSVPAATRAELGVTDGLVRISVGIEDLEDLLTDLEQALAF
jgi:cystathionine beta-lyase/cystathionine gamma-synthase